MVVLGCWVVGLRVTGGVQALRMLEFPVDGSLKVSGEGVLYASVVFRCLLEGLFGRRDA